MSKERILITVKTYPELSLTYGETVCTAGMREDGSWVRIYPVPFRRLEERERYTLYDWIECRLEKHRPDRRPESFRPVDQKELKPVGHIGTEQGWRERRDLLLRNESAHTRIADLIGEAKENVRSLAVFKPTRVTRFESEETERDWDPKKLESMRAIASQPDLFDDSNWRETFRVVRKLPYNFYYRFEDADGTSCRLRILEWQIGALYWNCLRSTGGDEAAALAKVRNMYYDKFIKSDLHFFLGTTLAWHSRAPNPWVIVGVFPIPHERQPDLFPPPGAGSQHS